MKSRSRWFVWLLAGLFLAGSGYLWWEGAPDDFDDEETIEPPAIQAAVEPAGPVKAEKLNVKLRQGASFPLRKTVTETVTQNTANGPLVSTTKLNILLAIRVQEVQTEKTRLRVDYQHVEYERTLGAEKVYYNSKLKSSDVPLEAQPYRGLVDNGFEFWIGQNHKVIETLDFRSFLERCVRFVPEAQREDVLRQFVMKTGEERIANFIDDSFGLLPKHDAAVKPGVTWKKTRQVARPIPLQLISDCTLTRLDDETANVEIHGKVTPSAPVGKAAADLHGVQLTITGGTITGQCRIRRVSGLPEHSDMTRLLEMTVRLPGGRQVRQTKKTQTVIAVYSPQGSPKALAMPTPAGNGSTGEPRRISGLTDGERR